MNRGTFANAYVPTSGHYAIEPAAASPVPRLLWTTGAGSRLPGELHLLTDVSRPVDELYNNLDPNFKLHLSLYQISFHHRYCRTYPLYDLTFPVLCNRSCTHRHDASPDPFRPRVHHDQFHYLLAILRNGQIPFADTWNIEKEVDCGQTRQYRSGVKKSSPATTALALLGWNQRWQ